MKFLYNDELTATEIAISDKIVQNVELVTNMSITSLAKHCEVSPSKITKYAKRLGFSGYKEFQYELKFASTHKNEIENSSDYQKDKIMQFFETFSFEKMEQLKTMILNADKTYLFGRGPSLKVCEYYEPRMRVATNKNIVSNYDEYLLDLDLATGNNEKKLMIVFTVSGKSKIVLEALKIAKARKMQTVCISSYYNQKLEVADLYINLLDRKELLDKRPIRGRTLFYIYLEILTQDFIEN